MFAFAGGITNWLAIKMLFERIPLLYGSGIIENQFVEIRGAIKDLVMETFFNTEYLDTYLGQKAGQLLSSFDVGKSIRLCSEEFTHHVQRGD